MQLGFIGLGKMGTRMVEKLLRDGHTIIGWNRSKDIVDQFKLTLVDAKIGESFVSVDDIRSLVTGLQTPRVIWMMLPAGDVTQSILDEIVQYVEPGDIIIDGGNAFYKDTQKRSEELGTKGIEYLGIGVSGGVKAIENGYPMMVGGSKKGFEYIKPILETLQKPHGGYEYFGEGGAGHFVKMVHNGIEYGMMQAIGEGYGVLEKAPYQFDLVKIGRLWQRGTIIESNLNEWAKDALENDPGLSEIEGVIDATGEAEWTVNQGKEEQVPVENIDQSLDFRRRSKTDAYVSKSFAARMVAALRREFGGHAVKKKG